MKSKGLVRDKSWENRKQEANAKVHYVDSHDEITSQLLSADSP